MKKITPKALATRIITDHALILDVRAKDKYETNPITGKNIENFHIPKTEILNFPEQKDQQDLNLPKNQEVIITCTTGNSASKCAAILHEKGYQVTLLEGGVTAWEAYQKDNQTDE